MAAAPSVHVQETDKSYEDGQDEQGYLRLLPWVPWSRKDPRCHSQHDASGRSEYKRHDAVTLDPNCADAEDRNPRKKGSDHDYQDRDGGYTLRGREMRDVHNATVGQFERQQDLISRKVLGFRAPPDVARLQVLANRWALPELVIEGDVWSLP